MKIHEFPICSMEQDFSTTVTYSPNPQTSKPPNTQTSKRTSFQDELKVVVNRRAVRNRASHLHSNTFDDDDDDDDEILNELLKTRRKKMEMFKSSRTKTSTNFQLSDKEEEENIRPKKVSFLKSQRNSNTLQSDTLQSDTLRSDTLQSDTLQSDTLQSDTLRSNTLQSDTLQSDRSLISHQFRTEVLSRDRRQQDFPSHSESPALQNSISESSACWKSLSEWPLPLYSEISQWESSSERVSLATPPTPAPRQRAPYSVSSAGDERDRETHTPSSRAAPPEISNTPTSASASTSAPTPTSTPLSSQTEGNSGSDAPQDGVSVMVNTHSRPLEGGDSTEQKRQENSQLDSEVSPLTDTGVSRSSASRTGSARLSRSAPSHSAGSRYLGTLKVLEQKLGFQETGLDTADSLRASVYQDWLKKKEEKLQVTLKAKKQEEKLKEEKKLEEETSKKSEAEASFEAWKKNKHEVLIEKVKEKQEAMKKLQKEKDNKEERKETAKQVFEKWKQEHDDVLRKQLQKQMQTEIRLKEKKQMEKELRMSESSSSVTQWNLRKKELMEKKLESVRSKKELKEMEEKYEKEERERTALEMYEDWLRKKEFQQKRERGQKNMKVTMVEEPPPPWSPPNRTVPFGK